MNDDTELLSALAALLTGAGEPIGAALFHQLAAGARARDQERAEAEAAEAQHFAARVALIAAEADAYWLSLDGGPSNPLIGAAEWIAGRTASAEVQ